MSRNNGGKIFTFFLMFNNPFSGFSGQQQEHCRCFLLLLLFLFAHYYSHINQSNNNKKVVNKSTEKRKEKTITYTKQRERKWIKIWEFFFLFLTSHFITFQVMIMMISIVFCFFLRKIYQKFRYFSYYFQLQILDVIYIQLAK